MQEGLSFQFGLADPFWFRGGVGIRWKADFRCFAATPAGAGRVNQGQFGGDLDAAAAFGVKPSVGDVGADVLVAPVSRGRDA
jgi:hypothetical protein